MAILAPSGNGRPPWRIDLSPVVSKWIGETEKHLARRFEQAEHEDSIAPADEVNALFGKRTEVRDARGGCANEEAEYLLQRIERRAGPVVLRFNRRLHIDAAFRRRTIAGRARRSCRDRRRAETPTRSLAASVRSTLE